MGEAAQTNTKSRNTTPAVDPARTYEGLFGHNSKTQRTEYGQVPWLYFELRDKLGFTAATHVALCDLLFELTWGGRFGKPSATAAIPKEVAAKRTGLTVSSLKLPIKQLVDYGAWTAERVNGEWRYGLALNRWQDPNFPDFATWCRVNPRKGIDGEPKWPERKPKGAPVEGETFALEPRQPVDLPLAIQRVEVQHGGECEHCRLLTEAVASPKGLSLRASRYPVEQKAKVGPDFGAQDTPSYNENKALKPLCDKSYNISNIAPEIAVFPPPNSKADNRVAIVSGVSGGDRIALDRAFDGAYKRWKRHGGKREDARLVFFNTFSDAPDAVRQRFARGFDSWAKYYDTVSWEKCGYKLTFEHFVRERVWESDAPATHGKSKTEARDAAGPTLDELREQLRAEKAARGKLK